MNKPKTDIRTFVVHLKSWSSSRWFEALLSVSRAFLKMEHSDSVNKSLINKISGTL